MKVLVLGGAGMLGHQVYLKLKSEFGVANVAITLRKEQSYYDKFGLFKEAIAFDNLDVQNFSQL